MSNLNQVLSHTALIKIDQELNNVFKNAPHLPRKVTDILVKIAPYMILVSGLFMITGGLQSIFGARSFHRLLDLWANIPPVYFYLTGLIQIGAGVLSVMAYKPLKDKQAEGWMMMLLLNLVSIVLNFITLLFFRQGLFGLLLGALLGFYLLYELRYAYKKAKTNK